MPRKSGFNLELSHGRLAQRSGPRFWRSLEELAETEEFRKCLEREFPENASEWSTTSSRRRFLKLMGASLALAGLSGCTKRPEEKIVPSVRAPEYRIPGKPWYYATAFCTGGFATGVLVESHMGRPTKVEGNEKHPASLGATDIFAQASLLTLYDPDRSPTVLNANQIGTWNSFLTDFAPRLNAFNANQGDGLRILTETTTSPTLASQMDALFKKFPKAKWHQFEPINRDNEREGLVTAFGRDLNPVYDFGQADVILSLGADFLTSGPASIPCSRQFMRRRDISSGQNQSGEMNRLYVVESTPTSTGAKADHRLALSPSEIEVLAMVLAKRLGVEVSAADESTLDVQPGFLDALADDLKNYRGKKEPGVALVVAGSQQPPLVHAVAHAINAKLGSVGRAVKYTTAIEVRPVDQAASLESLVDDLNTGKVDTLVMIDANPVYNAPPKLKFVEALAKAKYRVHMGLYRDETAWYCDWHIPESHYLETWSDVRAFDGTVTIIQPLIRPLVEGKSRHELIAALSGHAEAKAYDLVRKYWQSRKMQSGKSFDEWWDTCLHDGVVPDTQAKTENVSLAAELTASLDKLASGVSSSHGVELTLQPDPCIGDGRWANNGWLQELPKPISKLTWDNVALVSPAYAKENGLRDEDVVELKVEGQTLRVPILIQPGQPDNAIAVNLGFGRSRTGKVGTGVGANAYQLQSQASRFHFSDVSITKTGDSHQLALTQHHHLMEGRDLVRSGSLEQVNADPEHPSFMSEGHHGPHEPISLYPDYEYDGYKWGMSINLGGCIGCNACVVACQAENNIPVVGKEEVSRGREMQWIRVDQYYEGESNDPAMHFQPVACMHCELAPCEVVCPVAATTHSPEGINEMTYNRCIGTRYCSNNCPYKVRRFNFFHYTKPIEEHETLKMLQNPDVSVRARGVMEKCTYCVQRVNQARITAEKEQRSIRDGEVVTACQSACPTQAIVFGDLNDPNSKVTRAKNQPLDYVLLEEVNARPRTSYLASVFNPNPKLVPAEQHESAH